MVLALFVWITLVILSGFYLGSYLVWSPRTKSPYVIAAEVMHISGKVANAIGSFGIFLGTIVVSLGIFNFFDSFAT